MVVVVRVQGFVLVAWFYRRFLGSLLLLLPPLLLLLGLRALASFLVDAFYAPAVPTVDALRSMDWALYPVPLLQASFVAHFLANRTVHFNGIVLAICIQRSGKSV